MTLRAEKISHQIRHDTAHCINRNCQSRLRSRSIVCLQLNRRVRRIRIGKHRQTGTDSAIYVNVTYRFSRLEKHRTYFVHLFSICNPTIFHLSQRCAILNFSFLFCLLLSVEIGPNLKMVKRFVFRFLCFQPRYITYFLYIHETIRRHNWIEVQERGKCHYQRFEHVRVELSTHDHVKDPQDELTDYVFERFRDVFRRTINLDNYLFQAFQAKGSACITVFRLER